MLDMYVSNSERLRQEVLRAAEYTGHAAAMVANLSIAGNPDRAEVWEAERAAWHRRQSEALASVSLGRHALMDEAAIVTYDTYIALAVSELPVK